MVNVEHALGIDIGSRAVKAALVDGQQEILGVWSQPITGRPSQALHELLARVRDSVEAMPVVPAVTGSGRDMVRGDVHRESEIVALTMALPALHPGARTAIEIGSQSARYVVLDPDGTSLADYGLNQACAAGSGSFFEQQAGRLHMDVEQFALLASQAEKGATVAGRCSVFAKSDMIHLQQKGTPTEEIAYGLCLAMARNFVATVIRGAEVVPPVVLAGGAARNPGLVRAFASVMDLASEQLCVSPHPGAEGAVGVALSALGMGDLTAVDLGRVADVLDCVEPEACVSDLPPLHIQRTPPTTVSSVVQTRNVRAYLGVDVGSVSTNLVLLSDEGAVLDTVYLPTRGRPIEAIGEGLDRIRRHLGDELSVLGVGVTGSGRHLASHLLGADLVRNEITCQLEGALTVIPDVETILEIGGQDSKYIHARDGHIDDFVMNKICAAGTGSFLEEQAEHLGVAIVDEFARRAATSRAPAQLGCQCTVFMHSEVVDAQRSGTSTSDICAGLAYSVVRNYLERVVDGRPVGRSVVFQGGVARNPAVVAAFRSVLGVDVQVHPHAGVSGAIGAAHLVRSSAPDETSFRGLDACRDHQVSSFECRSCSNRCQVNRIVIEGRKVHFGDACEKYSSRVAARAANRTPDLMQRIEQIEADALQQPASPRGRIGIPRCSTLIDQLPFWSTFFASLGFEAVFSEPSSQSTLQKGLRRLPAETCLPIKLAFGHVQELSGKGLDHIFLPSILTRPGEDPRLSHSCPYVQAVPYMARSVVDGSLITPEVDLSGDEDAFVDPVARALEELDVDAFDVEDAYHDACAVRDEVRGRLLALGREALQDARRAIVVIGKPYNVLDGYVNMNLFKHLRRLGEVAIPMWCLPFEQAQLDEHASTLPWNLNRAILRALRYCAADDRLYPLVVSNFGCGPDAFTQIHLEHALGSKRSLVLEFDEHRAEAGLVTRLEAFLDEIDHASFPAPDTRPVTAPAVQPAPQPERRDVVMPYFSDHVHAYAGALRAAGHRVRILDLPGESTRKLGEAHSTGKECHPFSILTGDLVRVAREKRDAPRTFLYPGTVIPCLLHQYGQGHRTILENMGVTDLDVTTPGIAELKELLGIELGARMWRGLVAVDLLIRMLCEIRPYELERGRADEAHAQNLRDIQEAVASDVISEALTTITTRMRNIPVDRSTPRPLVGVAGDVYTRINPVGNQDLFTWLEGHGCEVWPSSFLVDITDFSLSHNWQKGSLGDAALLGALMLRKNVESWRVRRLFRDVVHNADEPGYRQVLAMASPYLGEQQNEVLVLNVAKMVDFARRGADGIVNAVCFNCMLGTVSAAITGRIRADHHQIPITNLVYTSVHGSQRASLDAFIHQVRTHAARRRAATPPPRPSLLSRIWPAD